MDKLDELFGQLMDKVTEKEDIELVASIKNIVNEDKTKADADLQAALGQVVHYKDLYKKSVLQGGFTNEPKGQPVNIPEGPKSFEEALKDFVDNNKEAK